MSPRIDRAVEILDAAPMIRPVLSCFCALALAGCLFTKDPVFDETNSVSAADSAEFLTFVEIWETHIGLDDTPRSIIDIGGRVARASPDTLVVQGSTTLGSKNYYGYFAVRRTPNGAPLFCYLDTDKMSLITRAAEEAGITIENVTPENKFFPDFLVVGERSAVVAFIFERLAGDGAKCEPIIRDQP